MTTEVVSSFLLWCTVINHVILLIWFLFFVFAHGFIQQVHGRWFHLSRDRFDALHYAAMAVYKIGILLFNLVPYVVFRIVG